MKRCASFILAVLLFVTCAVTGAQTSFAAYKANKSRAIAIVFDNSGSMYNDGDQAWCRATYAMEVFASMLNDGDSLSIYPMHPIKVGGKEYTMENPFRVTSVAQASQIRDIYTEKASGTPIESVDYAVAGLKGMRADQKYLIVLTDGDTFYLNGSSLGKRETKNQLDTRFQAAVSEGITAMYLGIGSNVVMPDTSASEYFVKMQAKNSEDVLARLTELCNLIFGRDSLPANHISGKTIDFDITLRKLIVFVQGEDVSNVKVTGTSGTAGKQVSAAATKYGTAGCGNYDSVPDTSLQGMIVTYTDCDAGTYTIEHSGVATNIEVYYEPDADLDFIFTDAAGKTVDSNALYEGDYKVSFGMKDAKTGELIESDLLGNPEYTGSYSINGEKHEISCTGYSGEVPVTLNMDDSFSAELTVEYLSGYTIKKSCADFGWSEAGIRVAARPAGDFTLEITGGDAEYSLQDLEEGSPFIAKVYYEGVQLTGDELKQVSLTWDSSTSLADIKSEFANDHYNLSLHYKDPAAPEETECGDCTTWIGASYTPKGCTEATVESPLSYTIVDDVLPVEVELLIPEDYIVISELDETEAFVVNLSMGGEPLTEEEFAAVDLQVDCGGVDYTLTPLPNESAYEIKLMSTDGIEADEDYPITATASYTDNIGRTNSTEDTENVTLSSLPLWLKWLLWLIVLLLLIILIICILRIRRLPKYLRPVTADCIMTINGSAVGVHTTFTACRVGKQLRFGVEYAGQTADFRVSGIKPAPGSFLCKPSHKRKILLGPGCTFQSNEVSKVDLNGVTYVVRDEKLVPEDEQQKAFTLSHGAPISFDGQINLNGRNRNYHAEIPLTFKKR